MGPIGWSKWKGTIPSRLLIGHRLKAKIEISYATDQGLRSTNQDRGAVSTYWAVVSDGAGGHVGGDIAAELAVEVVSSRFGGSAAGVDEALVLDALAEANAAVRARRRTEVRLGEMAATVTIAACTSSEAAASRWMVTNLGDSPVWHLRGDCLARLSVEDNVAAELVRAGVLSREGSRDHPGRHTITRALGITDDVAPHINHAILRPGDQLILASDGIEVLKEMEMLAVIAKQDDQGLSTAQRLVASAVSAGATDNVTVAVLRHLPLDAGGPTLATRAGAERAG
jgi:PPM family protein phosphatase